MEEILEMLFEAILNKNNKVENIATVQDLCDVAWDSNKVVRIFAANNDDQDGFSTEEILSIANKAYQEVCAQ